MAIEGAIEVAVVEIRSGDKIDDLITTWSLSTGSAPRAGCSELEFKMEAVVGCYGVRVPGKGRVGEG